MMIHSIFSSKDYTMQKADDYVECISLDASTPFVGVEEYVKEPVLGSSNILFDHSKYRGQIESILEQVNEKGLFVARFNKLNLPRDFLSELQIFRQKLLVWSDYCYETSIHMYKDPTWYFTQCLRLGPTFGTYLKDVLDYSLRKTMATGIFTLPDDINDIVILDDINEIFPPSHLIMWLQPPDYTDITQFSNVVPKLNNKILQSIKEEIREQIDSNVFVPPPLMEDTLSLMNNKKIISDKGQKLPSYRGKTFSQCYPNELIYDITHVTKSSCEGRVCAISSNDSRSLLKRGRELTTRHLKSNKWDYYGKKPWLAESKMNSKDGKSFIMYDQRKCGWTFPMEFLRDTFQVLYEETKCEEYNILYEIYRDKKVYYNICGETFRPQRGFTLGMWDNVLSFIMANIFNHFIENYVNEEDKKHFEGLFFGDDAVIIINQLDSYISIQHYWNMYISYLMSLGIEINTKKSFMASSGIFCEMYGDNDIFYNHKISYYLLNGLNPLQHTQTWERKIHLDQWNTQMESYSTFLDKDHREPLKFIKNNIIRVVIMNTRPEFDDFDHYFPLEGGGWLREIVEGRSTFLLKASEFKIPWNRVNLYTFKSFEEFASCETEYLQDNYMDNIKKYVIDHLPDFDVEHIVDQLLCKKINYYKATSTKNKIEKLKKKYSYKRKELYTQKKIYHMQLLSFIYKKGCKNQHFPKDMFMVSNTPDTHFVRYLKQTPHTYQKGFDLTLLRSVELFDMNRKTGNIDTLRDCIASIYKDISSSKYPIPIHWLKFILSHGLTVEELYERLLELNLDITEVIPSNAPRKEHFSNAFFPCEGDIAYWDDTTATYYEISYRDAEKILYIGDSEASEYLFNEYLRTNEVDYDLYCSVLCKPKEYEDLDITSDIQTIEDMMRATQPTEDVVVETIQTRKIDMDIYALAEDTGYEYNPADYDDSVQDEAEYPDTETGMYKGQYISYIDSNHEDFDQSIVDHILNKDSLDPVDYYLEIQEYPILGTFAEFHYSSDDDYG